MTTASTPINVQTAAGTTNTQVNVTWELPQGGNAGAGKFAVQFVNRTNPSDIITPPGSPFTLAAPAANAPYTQAIDMGAGNAAQAAAILSNYQAEVQTLAAAPADNSAWGKQIYWIFGFSLTVVIGGKSLTLTQVPGAQVYVLPVSPDNPLTITYQDLQNFAAPFLATGFTFPQNWPNGTPISSSLQINRLAIDTGNKLIDLDVLANIQWTLFTGFTIQSVGLAVQRTNGTPIHA